MSENIMSVTVEMIPGIIEEAKAEAFKAAENKDVFHQHAEMQLKLEDYMHRWEKTGEAIDNLNVQLTVENWTLLPNVRSQSHYFWQNITSV